MHRNDRKMIKELIIKLLDEISNVPELQAKVYYIDFFRSYIMEISEGKLRELLAKIPRTIELRNFRGFDSGSQYTIKILVDLYNQLDTNNKKVIKDYHDVITQILIRSKKEQ